MRLSWHEYALKLANVATKRSEDPYHKVGACVLRWDNSVAGVGYNGPPAGININWDDRDERRPKVVHAEANAFRYAQPDEVYLLACTLLPCRSCIQLAASYGITEIVYKNTYIYDDVSLNLCKEFGIKLFQLDNDQ
jgi:dCMP deaminase